MNTFRPALIAAALIGVLAAGAMGLTTLRGETREADARAACAAADWPLIPAECLENAQSRQVRVVGAAVPSAARPAGGIAIAMQERFAIAFQ
jgi:hypothetical protein